MQGLRWAAAAIALAVCCAFPQASSSALLPSARLAAKKPPKKRHRKAPARCKVGQARVQAGKRTICVRNSLPATHTSPQAVLAATSLALQLGHVRDRHGRRAAALGRVLRKGGPTTQKNLEQAISTGIARGKALALASALGRARASSAPGAFAAVRCGGTEAEELKKKLEEAPPEDKAKAEAEIAAVEKNRSFKSGEIEATTDFASGAIKLGIDTKAKGIRIDMTMRTCGGDGMHIDDCPTAQGKVEGHDKAELEASFKVTEGANVLFAQSFKFRGETTITAQTGDDGKLDAYDIKHVYELSGSFGGGSKSSFGPITVDTTYIGEAHIDMRAGTQTPPPAQVDVMLSMAGVDPAERIAAEIEMAHKAQTQADKEFAAEVEKATSNLRKKEAGWLRPNHCASVHFEPASETLKLKKGQTGTFKSRVEASKGGAPPETKWSLGAQQNATFTPGGGEANPLSTSYSVTNAGRGLLVSATVTGTSKAGVAEATWKQKTESLIETATGTFSGTDEREGELLKWTGSATVARKAASPEGASVLQPIASSVTVTVSGHAPTGCTVTGEEQVPIFEGSPFSVIGEAIPGVPYTIDLVFGAPGLINVVFSGCPPKGEGDGPGTVSLPGEAVLTGDALHGGPSALLRTSPDGVTFAGSATGTESESQLSWSWSFTGST